MEHLKKSPVLLMLLMVIIGSRTFAQNLFDFNTSLELTLAKKHHERANEIIQDNEYTFTGYEQGNFFSNPLMLNGVPLDYSQFGLGSKGNLTVAKGSPITGNVTLVPFRVYLRRNGTKVVLPEKEKCDGGQIQIDISEILKFAVPDDQLVIEAVKKEDGAVKRILKLRERGC